MMKRAWRYWISEPLIWTFYAFFQPRRLDKQLSGGTHWSRVAPSLRMIPFLSMIAYSMGLAERIVFVHMHIIRYTNIINILQDTLGNITIIIVFSIVFSIVFGIMNAVALGILSCIVFGMAFGILGYVAFGIIVGIIICEKFDIIEGTIFGVLFSILLGLQNFVVLGIMFGIIFGIVFGTVFGVVCGVVYGRKLATKRNLTRDIAKSASVMAFFLCFSIPDHIPLGLVTSITFLLFYLLFFFRVSFFLTSSLSVLKAYRHSCDNPQHALSYLQCSALHWDEIIYLPLPHLTDTLLIAYGVDSERALEEITFIAAERPKQIHGARAALLEIVVQDLERCRQIAEIAEASRFLDKLFPQETNLLDSQWAIPVTRIREASQDAARFCSPLGHKLRLEALQDMTKHLKAVHHNIVFRNAYLSTRLEQVVETWMALVRQEQDKLNQLPSYSGRIENPYHPGNALKKNDPLFLGRLDLVQILEMELVKEDHRPTFLMTGERRMGKSSTLLQLPRFLGSRFLPVFYDLQSPGIFASTATFLSTIADGIYKQFTVRNALTKPLDSQMLGEFSPSSTFPTTTVSSAYNSFDSWLGNVEIILERDERMLLLLFDEFEKLEEAGQQRGFELRLLLDWFRNIIQYHPRVALLFSGVHTFGEMGTETGINWAGYFVNVQTLRVSFLHEDEARRLISKPLSDFHSEEIYGDGVVERIIHETGGHPFLVQAVCSALIENLNLKKHDQANAEDVSEAIDLVFERWWDGYFRDLWYRTDHPQRTCLQALHKLQTANLQQICQESGLDEIAVRRTLQILLKRDLVQRVEGESYQISTPIFSEWVERAQYM